MGVPRARARVQTLIRRVLLFILGVYYIYDWAYDVFLLGVELVLVLGMCCIWVFVLV